MTGTDSAGRRKNYEMKKKRLSYILLRSIWSFFSLVPLPVMYFFSDLLFYPFYYLVRYRRKVVRKNLTEAFPEKSPKEIKRIEKEFYRFFLDIFYETNKYATISKKNFMRRMVFENMDEINRLLNEGKNISLYLGHYCNWEWVSALPLYLENRKVKAGQIYHEMNNGLVDMLLLNNRSRMGAVCIEMKQTLRWINEQMNNNTTTITGYIADQSGRKRDSYLNFLNHYVPVLVGAEKITKRYGMEAYYLDIVRLRRGYYKASFIRMDENPASLPDYKLTEIYYHYLEKTIRNHPEFYLWTHKRFKHAKPQ